MPFVDLHETFISPRRDVFAHLSNIRDTMCIGVEVDKLLMSFQVLKNIIKAPLETSPRRKEQ
jgi:hypothetical protein